MTGFAPNDWTWASETTTGVTGTLVVSSTGLYTVSLWMREDGLRLDRLLLTTDTTYLPTGFGPPESDRQAGTGGLLTVVNRTIAYDYDNLYRLTSAAYSTGQAYGYSYDPVGNRLQQIIDGDTTTYLYDAANRLAQVGSQGYTQTYTFDANGNLLNTGVLTNTFDTANRLIETEREGYILEPLYNGVGDRVGQTVGVTTTYFALDVMGLPEVIYTSEGNRYLHLPGVIMAESAEGEVRYLLSDGLGSIRQAVDETGTVVAYQQFDPYGQPVQLVSDNSPHPYGFTGEWWENDVSLLHLRARWYLAEDGIFLSRDPVEGEPVYLYVRGNPVNLSDPSGLISLQIIKNSLKAENDEEVKQAFWERPGLYKLLIEANPGKDFNNRIAAAVLDFGRDSWLKQWLGGPEPLPSDHLTNKVFPWPLRDSVVPTLAAMRIECIAGEPQLEFRSSAPGGPWSMSLLEYLDRIETAARTEFRYHKAWWRIKTFQLHYFSYVGPTTTGAHALYYDDFGTKTAVPDVIGVSGTLPGSPLSTGALVDRFGGEYIPLSGSLPLLSAGADFFRISEGYALGNPLSGTPRSRINGSREKLAGALSEWGVAVGGSIFYGGDLSAPLPEEDRRFLWYSIGFQVRFGIDFGYTFGPYYKGKRWDWLDQPGRGVDQSIFNNVIDNNLKNECICEQAQ